MKSVNDLMNILSERLLDLMQEKNLNPTTLSKLINIPRTTITGWLHKNRSPKIDNLDALADFFDVTIDYLLGREN